MNQTFMKPYPKIQSVFMRDPGNKYKTFLEDQWAMPEFEYLKDNVWNWYEKVDGTNIRVGWEHNEEENTFRLVFGGKTDKAQTPPFLLETLRGIFTPELMLETYPTTTMTLYGEGYGAKIQKGGGNYIRDGQGFILFDVAIDGVWLERKNVIDIAHTLGIQVVPFVSQGPLDQAIVLVRDGFLSSVAENKSHVAEGLVMKPACNMLTRRGERVITKVKYKDFN